VKQNRCDYREGCSKEGKIHPVPGPHKVEKQGADDHNAHNAVAVKGVEGAHILIGGVGRQRGHRGTYQNLAQSGGNGKDDRAAYQADIRVLREKCGDQCINAQTCGSEQGHDPYGFVNVKVLAEKTENQVDSQLCTEIDQHKCAQKCIGNAV